MGSGVDAYLDSKKEGSILDVIRNRRSQAEADFENFIATNLGEHWHVQRDNFLNHFRKRSRGAGDERPPVNYPRTLDNGSDSSDIETEFSFTDVVPHKSGGQDWAAKEQTFSQAIHSLNEHRLMRQPVAIGSLMAQLTRSLGADVKTHQLADSWHILSFIVNEKHIEHGRVTVGKILQPREYMSQYLAHPVSDQLHNMVVDGSRRYLEDQFYSLIEREITKNPHHAKLGGAPTVESKVKAFVNLRLSKNGVWLRSDLDIINNVPVWAILFYLVRAGFLQEAADYTRKHEAVFIKIEKNWSVYMLAFATSQSRDLPRHLQERLHTEYNQRIKFAGVGLDPYKKALYKIIGRCDLTHKSLAEVLPITEDWMWLQLCLLRSNDGNGALYEQYELVTLQKTLLSYGERHFNPKGTSPVLYFQMLLLSGQFERSIQYLAEQSWTDAVHFAIVLVYYGLLRVAAFTGDKNRRLMLEEGKQVELDFSSMIETYVRQIRTHNAVAAVEYIALICLNSDVPGIGASQSRRCQALLKSLVLKTREFALLLGDLRADGTRDMGFIERRLALFNFQEQTSYLGSICEQAAAVSEQDGRIADAILLYHLSEDYDVALGLVNKSLGDALLTSALNFKGLSENLSLANTDNPASLAKNMLELYKGNATIYGAISPLNKQNCSTLLAMVSAHDSYASQNYDTTLSCIEGIGIFPLADDLSISQIKARSQNTDILDACVARNIPNLLLLTAKSLKIKFEKLAQGEYNDQARSRQRLTIKRQLRNLSTFAGFLQYEINEDTRLTFESVIAAIR